MSKKLIIIVTIIVASAILLFAGYNLFLLLSVYRPMNIGGEPAEARFSDADGQYLTLENGYVSIGVDMTGGRYDISYGGKILTADAYSYAVIGEGGEKTVYTSFDAESRAYGVADITDGFGSGVLLTVKNAFASLEMEQRFYLYDGAEYLINQIVMNSSTEIASNDMRQILSEKYGGAKTVLGNMKKLSILETPYDNNEYEEFTPRVLGNGDNDGVVYGYGASMIFSESEREALVIGAIDNSVFKNALFTKSSSDLFKTGRLDELYMHFGKVSYESRDYNNRNRTSRSTEHGYIRGASLESPRMFYGYYKDYRDGLEQFGDAAAVAEPPLEWTGATPVGYNSWAALGFDVSYETLIETSDFIKENLPSLGGDSAVYINCDSGFENLLSAKEKKAFVEHANANGQKAGAYWTPFSRWQGSESLDESLTDRNGSYIFDENGKPYTLRDIIVKDKNGEPIKYGGYAVDATHPAALKLIDQFLEMILDLGYEYLKIDFINDGAMEGTRYDETVGPTGLAAFNYGMKHIKEFIYEYVETHNREPFFINAAISPIFSGRYLHSRRISCDVFEKSGNTAYLVNSLTYAWWMNGRIISVSDPDHLVLYTSIGTDGNTFATLAEADAAAVSRIIGGGLILWSDNLAYDEAKTRAVEILGNTDLLAVAAKKKTFRPLYAGEHSNTFYLSDGGALYVALFNFDTLRTRRLSFDVAALGYVGAAFKVKNLNTGEDFDSGARVAVNLPAAAGYVFEITTV
ncbi:MAG: hypothetical protein LBP79_07135 [Clostridiales bacterium]|jgi:hypothetical protein|nr:hypothetical protein [Clostridiales bacterium]